MHHPIKQERITDSTKTLQKAGLVLGGLPRRITKIQIRNAISLVNSGEPAAQVPLNNVRFDTCPIRISKLPSAVFVTV